jgi:hypothetical protein
MALEVGSLVTRLLADSSGVRKGVDEANAALRQHTDEQKKLVKQASETREVMKKALAGEVIINQSQQIAQAFSNLHTPMAAAAAFATQTFGRIAQAGFQGGALGLLSASAGTGIQLLIENWNATGRASIAAADRAKEALGTMRDEAMKSLLALRAVKDQLVAIQQARDYGGSVASAQLDVQASGLSVAIQSKQGTLRNQEAIMPALATAMRNGGDTELGAYFKAQAEIDQTKAQIDDLSHQWEAVAAQMQIAAQATKAATLTDAFGDVSKTGEQRGGAAGLSALGAFNARLVAAKDALDPAAFKQLTKQSEDLAVTLKDRAAAEKHERENRGFYGQQAFGIRAFADFGGHGATGPEMPALSEAQSLAARKVREYEESVAESLRMRQSANAYDAQLEAAKRAQEDRDTSFASARASADYQNSLQSMSLGDALDVLQSSVTESSDGVEVFSAAVDAAKSTIAKGLASMGAGHMSGTMGDVVKGGMDGFQNGGFIGAIAEAGMALLSHSKQFQHWMDQANAAIQPLADAFGSMLTVIQPLSNASNHMLPEIGHLVSSIIGIAGDLSGPVINVMSGFAAGLDAFVAGVNWVVDEIRVGIDNVVLGVEEFLDSVPGLDFSKEIAATQAELDKIRPKKGFAETVEDAYNNATKPINDLAHAAGSAADAMLNLPTGIKVAAARFAAIRADETGGITTSTQRLVSSSGLPVADGVHAANGPVQMHAPGSSAIEVTFTGPVSINGDPAKWEAWLRAYLRRQALTSGGTDAGLLS